MPGVATLRVVQHRESVALSTLADLPWRAPRTRASAGSDRLRRLRQHDAGLLFAERPTRHRR
jgi:hypothetical protein